MSLKRMLLVLILPAIVFFSYPYFFNSTKIHASGELLNPWIVSPKVFPNQLASNNSVFIGNKLFVLGGANNEDFSEVYATDINIDGSLVNWTFKNNLPETRYWASLANSNNRIYLLGGARFDGLTTYMNTSYSSIVQNDGSLSSWVVMTPLPQAVAQGGAVIVGDYLYYMGGRNSTGVKQDIYIAHINTNGTLGSWSTSPISIPAPRYAMGIGSYLNNIYIVGGVGNGGVVTDKAYRTTVNPTNGSISAFVELASLPHPTNGTNSTVIVGNKIITVAGGDSFVPINNVFYTDINPDGSLAGWHDSTNPLLVKNGGGAAAYGNGYLYYTGGYSNGYQNTVYYSKLNIELETTLNVPLLKQTDPAWGSQLYDSANFWASKNPIDIDFWGCALTSVSMILQYHGITKLPDGTALNPGSLNKWLLKQSDGYINGGNVGWNSISRLSKISKSKNPGFNFDSLELRQLGAYSLQQLGTDIKNNLPIILQEPGVFGPDSMHFIVAKGTKGSTFTINDPAWDNRIDLTYYNNSFTGYKRYVPSNSDLSYLVLSFDDNIDAYVKDSNNNEIGQTEVLYPISSFPMATLSGKTSKLFSFAKPTAGLYKIHLSSQISNLYTLTSYLYDKNGNVNTKIQKGILGNEIDTFTINFDKDDSTNSDISQNYSYDSLISDIDLLCAKKLIKNSSVCIALREKAVKAKAIAPKNKATAKAILQSFIIQLDSNRKKVVLEEAWQIVSPEALFLKNSL